MSTTIECADCGATKQGEECICLTPIDRAKYARRAIVAHCPDNEDNESSDQIIDLLTDLLHLAKEEKFHFDFCLDVARRHFFEEWKQYR